MPKSFTHVKLHGGDGGYTWELQTDPEYLIVKQRFISVNIFSILLPSSSLCVYRCWSSLLSFQRCSVLGPFPSSSRNLCIFQCFSSFTRASPWSLITCWSEKMFLSLYPKGGRSRNQWLKSKARFLQVISESAMNNRLKEKDFVCCIHEGKTTLKTLEITRQIDRVKLRYAAWWSQRYEERGDATQGKRVSRSRN